MDPFKFFPWKPPELKTWLRHSNFLGKSGSLTRLKASRIEGNGYWIFTNEAFRGWHWSSESSILCLTGDAGTGKSTMAASIVSYLRHAEHEVPILFFFNRAVDPRHALHMLLRDWLAQLVEFSWTVEDELERIVRNQGRPPDDVSVEELWSILLRGLGEVRRVRVYCVADGLDEMDPSSSALLERFLELGYCRPITVKLLLTSRPVPHLQGILSHPSVHQVRIDHERGLKDDISFYVKSRLLRAKHTPSVVYPLIQSWVERQAGTSFLYAHLAVNRLVENQTRMDVATAHQALSMLPRSLTELYTEMLRDTITKDHIPQQDLLVILQLVTHCARPLRLNEIAEALDLMLVAPKGLPNTKVTVRASCGPLLEVLRDETVLVNHRSVTDFLLDSTRSDDFPIISQVDAHELLAKLCLQYLTSGCLNTVPIRIKKELDRYDKEEEYLSPSFGNGLEKQLRVHPMLDYALNHWYFHVRHSRSSPQILALLEEFLDPRNKPMLVWVCHAFGPDYALKPITSLHIAAWTGMTNYADILLQGPFARNLDPPDEKRRTPLGIAARRGHTETAKLLLERGASPDLADSDCVKPLHYAASGDHYEIVKALLVARVSPVTDGMLGYRDSTPLERAFVARAGRSIHEMIPYLSADRIGDAICLAAGTQQLKIVELLTEKPGANINCMRYETTALFQAAQNWDWQMVELLLQRGADPNLGSHRDSRLEFSLKTFCKSSDSGSPRYPPLHGIHRHFRRTLDYEHQRKTLEALLQGGADINAGDYEGQTLLMEAVGKQADIAFDLLRHGADPNIGDSKRSTPLHEVMNGTR